MKLKVCGNRNNITEVAAMEPDYLGFIFWEPSSRYFSGKLPELPQGIKKVGVFVDALLKEILDKVAEYHLDLVQLHGGESAAYCQALRERLDSGGPKKSFDFGAVKIIKAFAIQEGFDFNALLPFEAFCDYYLFDTKGPLPGGNGFAFDWTILNDYPFEKPFFLSGGIGSENREELVSFQNTEVASHCAVVDVNSKFESTPGTKKIKELIAFKELISQKK